MVAFFCVFIPPLIYTFLRAKLLKNFEDIYKSILIYIVSFIALNFLMILILWLIFDNYGQLIYKLNHFYNFSIKYFSLSTFLAAGEACIEKYLKGHFVLSKIKIFVKNNRGGLTFGFIVIISIVIFVALMLIGSLKVAYHPDEIYTFGLANHQYKNKNSIHPEIVDGEEYSGQQLWEEYVMVSPENAFDYANVFANQARDVHPPLYYILIHTIFSLFPNTYKVQYALLINALLALIVFWQIVWLFNYFIESPKISVVFSLLFVFTMGFINSVVFFRMYVLLEVWSNALIILFCKYKPQENNFNYYLSLSIILIGGIMTQYYFLIFAFFACLIYAFRTAINQNWKKITLSIVSVAISIGICTLIFPNMWAQIFTGKRGQEAFTNLTTDGFWHDIWSYLNTINHQVFGDMFLFLAIVIILLFIINSKTNDKNNYYKLNNESILKFSQVIIPVVLYTLLVAKISPFKIDRYVMNIMGMLYCVVFSGLILLAFHFSKQAVTGVIAIAACVLFCSYKNGVPYLYTSEAENQEKIASLGTDIPCLYIYDSRVIITNYIDLKNLEDIIFINKDNLEELKEKKYQNYDRLLMFIAPNNADEIIDLMIDENRGLDSYEKLFTHGYATVYLLD